MENDYGKIVKEIKDSIDKEIGKAREAALEDDTGDYFPILGRTIELLTMASDILAVPIGEE